MTFFLDVLQQTLYEQTPMRTALLTWEFHGLDLIVLADESYHGQEKAMKIMKQLNSDRYMLCAVLVIIVTSIKMQLNKVTVQIR